MGNTIIAFDYGRRAEYLTSVFLSPYAITVPIRGHDDRVESDFLCVGFEEESKNFVPNLKLIFWVQTKSQSAKKPKVIIKSKSSVDSILNNKMPYFIALVNTKSTPTLELYNTSERIAFRHSQPYLQTNKLIFVPGMPLDKKMYLFNEVKKTVTIYMGEPFLTFTNTDYIERVLEKWQVLKNNIEREFRNFNYASVGLGSFEREALPWSNPGEENRLFFPSNGSLTKETTSTIRIALQMFDETIIAKERKSNPKSKIVRANDIIKKYLNSKQL